jgi:hypothetical protein
MSQTTYADTKREILDERGTACECGCWQQGHDLHHCFIHNMKQGGKTKYPILNDPRNLVLVNHDEHIARKFDNIEWRKYFWEVQVDRYGYDKMMEWVNALPDKIKSRMDWAVNAAESR